MFSFLRGKYRNEVVDLIGNSIGNFIITLLEHSRMTGQIKPALVFKLMGIKIASLICFLLDFNNSSWEALYLHYVRPFVCLSYRQLATQELLGVRR